MSIKNKIYRLPAWVYATICLVIFTPLTFITDYWLIALIGYNNSYAYLLFGILSAFACYLIIRNGPQSIWYVPLIINAFFILSSLVGDFDPWYIPGWIITIISSVFGYRKGKARTV
jgi:hypothetical protein